MHLINSYIYLTVIFGCIVFIIILYQQHWSISRMNIEGVNRICNYYKVFNSQIPWFMKGGTVYPKESEGDFKLLIEDPERDRIVEQLMFIPMNYKDVKEKSILSYAPFSDWDGYDGKRTLIGYKFDECPVQKCTLTDNKSKANEVDAILFQQSFTDPRVIRPSNQIWIMFILESPYNTNKISLPDAINWTATYRLDSDVPFPYGKWLYYDPNIRQKSQEKNFAANKTKKVAWFVSNCNGQNKRLRYAKTLAKYIDVDIYGRCGTFSCARTDTLKCFELLRNNYKFYLSFENSNCKDYITEKLFTNAFENDILPIVMGTTIENYMERTPQDSFLHVDNFSSPKDLATYLHKLDQDDELYNSYFKWKGTGEIIRHHFWCRLCAMLHADLPQKNYENINDCWSVTNSCS